MKKISTVNWGKKIMVGLMTLLFVLTLGLVAEQFALISYAQSQGKVSARSAKIRKEASTSSEALAGVSENDQLDVLGQVTGSDGSVWYQVYVDANTKGFIRSDLVKITDGTTPPTITVTNETSAANETAAPTETEGSNDAASTTSSDNGVTEVNPVSGTTTAANVRVRANASTGGQIVASVENGFALTVNGTANGTDGKVWYRVNFNTNGAEITGFIRSDFVSLSGELTPAESQNPGEDTSVETDPAGQLDRSKEWDTQYDGNKWYLVDNDRQQRYEIQQFFKLEESATQIQKLYEDEHKQNKTQKALVIGLVILVILLIAAIAFLLFKLKDMRDAKDLATAEKERAGRRTADRPAVRKNSGVAGPGSAQASGRTVQRPQKPQGARPQGQARASRPQGGQAQRPQNGQPNRQGQGTAQKPQKPQNPAGARPTGARGPQNAQAARPQTQSQPRPSQNVQSNTPRPQNPAQNTAKPAASAKSAGQYANADDEFEFEFLNWDGNEEL